MASRLGSCWRYVLSGLPRESVFEGVATKDRTLFSFAEPSEVRHFRCVSDSQDGGLTNASISHSTEDGGKLVFSGELRTNFTGLDSNARVTEESFGGARMVRSGYCAFRSVEPPAFGALDEYSGLTLLLRSDNRPYIATVRTERFLQDESEIYQLLLPTIPKHHAAAGGWPWRRIDLPFDKFFLTWRGFLQGADASQLDPRRIQSIGISLLATEEEHEDLGYSLMRDGPFCLELKGVRAFLGTQHWRARGCDVEQRVVSVDECCAQLEPRPPEH